MIPVNYWFWSTADPQRYYGEAVEDTSVNASAEDPAGIRSYIVEAWNRVHETELTEVDFQFTEIPMPPNWP